MTKHNNKYGRFIYLWIKHTSLLLYVLFYQSGYAQLSPIDVEYIDGLPEYSRSSDIIRDNDGLLWFSYEEASNGLYIFDGQFLTHVGVNTIDSGGLLDVNINDMYKDIHGHIWLGTDSKGIGKYDPNTDQFSMIKPNFLDDDKPEIHHIVGTNNDEILWMASKQGLIKLDTKTQDFKQYKFDVSTFSNLVQLFYNGMHCIAIDPIDKNKLWIGSVLGLISFDIKEEKFTHYPFPWSARKEVSYDNDYYLINSLLFVDNENLWAGSWAGGIFHFNTKTQQWKRYRDKEIIYEDDVYYDLKPKNDSELWVLSNRGLGVFNIKEYSFEYYDDVPSRGYERRRNKYGGAFMPIEDSGFVTLGIAGGAIAKYNNKKGKTQERLFPPLIRKINIEGQLLEQKNITYDRALLSLNANQNNVSISIASPCFIEKDSLTYRYMLKGYDGGWQYRKGKTVANYAITKGGNYAFAYQVSNDGINWLEGQEWKIEKSVPFWKYDELKYLLAIFFILLALLYKWLVSRQAKKEKRLQEKFQHQLAESEMSTLRAQMNPHFIFNSLNSIKTFILKEETKDANEYLNKFSQLIRLVLKNSKSKLIPLEQELKALQFYVDLEQLRFGKTFECEFIIADEVDLEQTLIPPMLIQPYVENAIWHGLMHKKAEGILSITISKIDDKIVIIIQDNGIGRKKSAEIESKKHKLKKSFGMKITKDRIELLKKSMGIDAKVEITDLYNNDTPLGTKVQLTLPEINEDKFPHLIKQYDD